MNRTANVKSYDFGFLELADRVLMFALTVAVAAAFVSGVGAIGNF